MGGRRPQSHRASNVSCEENSNQTPSCDASPQLFGCLWVPHPRPRCWGEGGLQASTNRRRGTACRALRAERCNRRRIERNPHLAAAPAPMVRFLFPVAPAFRPAPASLRQGTPSGVPQIGHFHISSAASAAEPLAAFHMNSVTTPASCISWSRASAS